MTITRIRSDRGVALVEAAITIPLLLLVAVAIFEFGRAYQTWQVLTNAAREGARMAVLPGTSTADVEARVRSYMRNGQLPASETARVAVQRNVIMDVAAGGAVASQVTVDYPFDFMVLQPVVRMVAPGSRTGEPLTMRAAALMRNETQ